MFEGQPKGLYALALANTGERFGYYTMLAIFTLFLQAKFGLSESAVSQIFAIFLGGVYFMPLIGGILADKFGFGNMVKLGFLIMFVGYALLAIPTAANDFGFWSMIGALALIAVGTGLFKGNLQVMVGNLYDEARYSSKRDTAFSLFYMAINIGAMFAPYAATQMTNWMMGRDGFTYSGAVPNLAHQYLNGSISSANLTNLQTLQAEVAPTFTGDLAAFCNQYIASLSQAYNYAFAIACISLIVSVLIYFVFRSTFKHVEGGAKAVAADKTAEHHEELTPQETKQRVVALVLVFLVVIFFWMAFHQNGLTLTFFARDYTADEAIGLSRIGFNIWCLALIAALVYSAFSFFQSKVAKTKTISGIISLLCIGGVYAIYSNMDAVMSILPQQFQQFNPFFVVALTPFSLLIFSRLAAKGKEPSAPRKIAYGMVIAAFAYFVLAFFCIGMPTPDDLKQDTSLLTNPASPNTLISIYLILTFAELLLSPMGISFVSKVAPPKLKGMMMGGWFAATAVGNYAVSIIGEIWGSLELVYVWGVLVVLCLLAAVFMFSMMKRLEKVG